MTNRKVAEQEIGAEQVPAFNPNRLRQATLAQGLTQEQVARALGLSMRGVQKWFLGDGAPKGGTLIALSRLLGKDPGWFYEDSDTNGEAA